MSANNNYIFKKLKKETAGIFIGLLFLISVTKVGAQPKLPNLEIGVAADKTAIAKGDIIIVSITASVPKGCYVYSTNIKCEVGPLPPNLTITNIGGFEKVGEMYSEGDKSMMDEIFECEVSKFTKTVLIKQKFKVIKPSDALSGIIEVQMCSDEIGVCLPREKKFTLNFTNKDGSEAPIIIKEVIIPKEKEKSDDNPAPIADSATKQVQDTNILPTNGAIYLNEKSYVSKTPSDIGTCSDHQKSYEGSTILDDFNKGGLWGLFLLAFIAGLAALITPCVFPMIPMTVTYFLKKSKSKSGAIFNALLFGLFIIIVYEILGLIFAVAFGPETVNYIATAALPNIIFFAIFLLFAFSFFGAFELTLPASLTTKLDQKADKGGYLGIFFMALTLAVVSFSCTGPIVATVLVQSADGQFIKPLIAMGGFALAFALPFTLAAIFPSLLNAMPKSGGWLNSVKVCLGFVEIAFGLKFLSIADQTYHWGILDREIYLGIWIVLFALMGIYLLGKIKFAHDSDLKFLSIPRLLFTILTFTFVLYLIPGLWGAPLKGLSGYLPPMSTQDFVLGKTENKEGNILETPLYGNQLEIPHGLQGYFDYDQALSNAAKLNKPLFLDFTGHGCVNCRKMEENVWNDPRILDILRKEYVVVSLYVDDKVIQLPKEEYFISKVTGDLVTTLGKKNATIQQCLYGILAQPQYIVIDNQENLLNSPTYSDFTEKAQDNFYDFLKKGVLNYKKSGSGK